MESCSIGVLSDPAYIRVLNRGELIESAEISSLAGEELGVVVYFFSYSDVNLDNQVAVAFHRAIGGWRKSIINLPKIIYDRAFSCPASFRKNLMNIPNMRFVNEKIGFWKWETHLALNEFTEILPYLPETYFFKNDVQLEEMLQRYGRAALKPVYGQKAVGLILFSSANGKVNYQYRGRGQERAKYFKGSLKQIKNIREIFKVMGKEQYIVQQGLELARYQNRVFDVRALMQKDINKEWVISLCLKVGPEQSDISALGDWLEIEMIEKYLIDIHGDSFHNILPKVKRLSLLVSGALERAYAPVGEIGLDIGIDVNGNVWLIEVNSMPAKSMFHKLLDKKGLFSIHALPIQYACCLAKEICRGGVKCNEAY